MPPICAGRYVDIVGVVPVVSSSAREAAVIELSVSCLFWRGDGRAAATWHKSKEGVIMLRTRERERRVGNQALGENGDDDVKAEVE